MNEIAAAKRFTPCLPERAGALVAGLFAVVLSPKNGAFDKAMASAYVEALSGIPEWAISEAAALFRTGRLGDGKFVPLPGEFGKAARRIADEARAREADEVARQREISERERIARFHAGKTIESRRRVAELTIRTKAVLEKASAELALAANCWRDYTPIPEIEAIKAAGESERQESWQASAREALLRTLVRDHGGGASQ